MKKIFILFLVFCVYKSYGKTSEFVIKKNNRSEKRINLSETIIDTSGDILELNAQIDLENKRPELGKVLIKEIKDFSKDKNDSFLLNSNKIGKQELLDKLNEIKSDLKTLEKLEVDLGKKIFSIKKMLKG